MFSGHSTPRGGEWEVARVQVRRAVDTSEEVSEDVTYLSGLTDVTKEQKGRRKEKHSPPRKQWKEKCKIMNIKTGLACLVSDGW